MLNHKLPNQSMIKNIKNVFSGYIRDTEVSPPSINLMDGSQAVDYQGEGYIASRGWDLVLFNYNHTKN